MYCLTVKVYQQNAKHIFVHCFCSAGCTVRRLEVEMKKHKMVKLRDKLLNR